MAVKGLFADTGLDRIRLHGQRLNARVTEAVLSAVLTRTMEGASTLAMTLKLDDDYELLRSPLFTQRVGLNLDGLVFELVQVGKAGRRLNLTFEDGLIADLRRNKGPGPVAAPGTTTRTTFARRLVREVKYAKFKGESGEPIRVAVSRGGKHGGGKREDSYEALVRLAADRGWRAFAAEDTFYFGGDDWLLDQGEPFVLREGHDGVDNIDFDYDGGKRANTATVQFWVKRWAARPGVPVELRGLGPLAREPWLLATIDRSLFSQRATGTLVRQQKELPEPKPPPEPHDDSQSDTTGGGTAGGGSRGGWQWPVVGPITSDYGAPRSYGGHTGIDIGVPNGTPVRAARTGTVVFAGVMGGYGNCMDIDHGGGFKSRYAHLQSFNARSGHRVNGGDVVALSDNTGASSGPHLHFGIYVNGSPVDPKKYLP